MGKGSVKCEDTRRFAKRSQVEGVSNAEASIVDESGSEKRTTDVDKDMLGKSHERNSCNPLLYIPPRSPRGIVKRTVQRRRRQRRNIGDGKGRRKKTTLETTSGWISGSNDVAVAQDSLASNAVQGKQGLFKNSRAQRNRGENGNRIREIKLKQENVLIKGKELPEGGHAAASGHVECVHDKQSFDLEPHSIPEELKKADSDIIGEPIGISCKKYISEWCGDARKESKRKDIPTKDSSSMARFHQLERQESPRSPMEQPIVVQKSQVSEDGKSDSRVDTGRNELLVEGDRHPVCTALGPSGVDMRLNLIPVGSAPLLERAVIRTSGLIPMTVLASFIHCSFRLPREQSIIFRCCGEDLGSVMALTLQQFTKCMRIEPGGILELGYELL